MQLARGKGQGRLQPGPCSPSDRGNLRPWRGKEGPWSSILLALGSRPARAHSSPQEQRHRNTGNHHQVHLSFWRPGEGARSSRTSWHPACSGASGHSGRWAWRSSGWGWGLSPHTPPLGTAHHWTAGCAGLAQHPARLHKWSAHSLRVPVWKSHCCWWESGDCYSSCRCRQLWRQESWSLLGCPVLVLGCWSCGLALLAAAAAAAAAASSGPYNRHLYIKTL